jgi:hypothetical protein
MPGHDVAVELAVPLTAVPDPIVTGMDTVQPFASLITTACAPAERLVNILEPWNAPPSSEYV